MDYVRAVPIKESRLEIIKAKLPYLSFAERLVVKSILFYFKNIVLVENNNNLLNLNDPVVFAFNHNTYWETLIVSCYLLFQRNGKKICFVIDWMYGQLPLLSWLFNRVDPIYVYNKKAKIAAINRRKKLFLEQKVYQECVERLKSKKSIAIFPEGTRNHDPFFLKRGRKGVGAMVLASGAAVVPIGIHFPRGAKRSWLVTPGSMVLRIGEALDFAAELELARQYPEDPTRPPVPPQRRSTLLAAHITHGVMEALARLSGKQYPYPAPKALPQLQAPKYLKVPEELCHGLKPVKC